MGKVDINRWWAIDEIDYSCQFALNYLVEVGKWTRWWATDEIDFMRCIFLISFLFPFFKLISPYDPISYVEIIRHIYIQSVWFVIYENMYVHAPSANIISQFKNSIETSLPTSASKNFFHLFLYSRVSPKVSFVGKAKVFRSFIHENNCTQFGIFKLPLPKRVLFPCKNFGSSRH